MMQTAEIETARPVIRIVDDDEVFLASQKFFFETFFPEVRVWPCAKRYLDEEDLRPGRSARTASEAQTNATDHFFERPW